MVKKPVEAVGDGGALELLGVDVGGAEPGQFLRGQVGIME